MPNLMTLSRRQSPNARTCPRPPQAIIQQPRSLGPDTDLTDLGREQATRLGNWLVEQGYAFTALYCSTLRRARQAAGI